MYMWQILVHNTTHKLLGLILTLMTFIHGVPLHKNHFMCTLIFSRSFNPMLSKLNYETVKITQKMILYSSSDLCAIRERPHPLINMENYIPY